MFLTAIACAWLLLFAGDFISTFCYHVPEHIFGKLHLKTHHSADKDFRHYAVLSLQSEILLDGILGAVPYIIPAVFLWNFSPIGVICGLAFGQFHVWWRHTSILGWRSPFIIRVICKVLFITTPERHWIHHQEPNEAYGDIFTVFNLPAKIWLRWLRLLRSQWRIKNNHKPVSN